jgi:hypothetical protein
VPHVSTPDGPFGPPRQEAPTTQRRPVLHTAVVQSPSTAQTLASPHLFGADDNAYWKSYDWSKALTAGAKAVGQNYSGAYGFIRTQATWPQTHMVAPAEKALSCEECHTKSADGRLANLKDFYLPGRDSTPAVENFGLIAIIGTVLGIGGHGISHLTRKNKK